MHISMVTARYWPLMGGIETHVAEVARRLVRQGHQVSILTTDRNGDLPPYVMIDGVAIHRVRAWPRTKDYYFAPGLSRLIRRLRPDLVHIQGYHTLSAPLGMLAAVLNAIPFVVTFHSGGHSSFLRNAARGLQRLALKPLLFRASHLIGVSRFETELFQTTLSLPAHRFSTVPNGAEFSPSSASDGSDGEELLVLSVGRLERYKGHHRVIAAFPFLLAREPNARLQIVGSGPYEAALRFAADKTGVADRISILSIPPERRTEMKQLMQSAALVTLLSDYEAHPVAVMEALSLQRSVLVSDTSGFSELAEQGLVRAIPLNSRPENAAAVMLDLLRTPHARTEVKLPDWNTCADRLAQIYEKVLAHHHAGMRATPRTAAIGRSSAERV